MEARSATQLLDLLILFMCGFRLGKPFLFYLRKRKSKLTLLKK
jgi:hypothetical protein